jgi:hypothetical protein
MSAMTMPVRSSISAGALLLVTACGPAAAGGPTAPDDEGESTPTEQATDTDEDRESGREADSKRLTEAAERYREQQPEGEATCQPGGHVMAPC